MATLYIGYYSKVTDGIYSDPIKTETVTTSGTSAQSAAIPLQAQVAVLWSTAQHAIALGTNPTAAAATGGLVPASWPLVLDLNQRTGAGALKLAAITV